jgi:tetratricopeptide (TPR) repeat protein
MGRLALFRLGAILLGLSPLVVSEITLSCLGLGRPTDYDDPFVGFSAVHPLFVLNEDGGRYEIAPSRLEHFCADSFAAKKPANEFRVFVLGGSTVQGRPWTIETSFTTWLEIALNAADPRRKWEVVNCGGVSYASYRLVPILQEVLNYQPDLVIFCEGHNEFLEDRSYAHIKSAPAVLAWPARQAARLRTYNVLRSAALHWTGKPAAKAPDKRPVLGPEAYTRLDWRGGMETFRRDAAWQRQVIEHFEFNLRRLADIARARDVPLIFVSPVSNLEWPPFKPEPGPNTGPEERLKCKALLAEAGELFGSDPARAAALLRQAATIDPQHALVRYQLGLALRELGQMNEAETELRQAKELDVCPLRMLEPMKERILAVARQTGTPLVDAEALIAAQSRTGFPDNQWLIDHVHPKLEGHQLIAEALVEKMAGLGHVRIAANWAEARDAAYAQHLASLPVVYFERGRQRLRSEQGWARGFVKRERMNPSINDAQSQRESEAPAESKSGRAEAQQELRPPMAQRPDGS